MRDGVSIPRVVLSLLAAAGLAGGCATEPDADVGVVGVALTATDGTGGTYRLPAATYLELAGGIFDDQFLLDGDAPFVRLTVPPGGYAATLSSDAGYTTDWPLERTAADGTVTTVDARLTTAMPAPVTVVQDQMTNLVLGFQVDTLGPVVFSNGTVDVSLDVDEVASTSFRTGVSGTVNATSVIVNAAAPAALAPRMPASGATGIALGTTLRVTGEWARYGALYVCAPATVESTSAGQAGLADLLTESGTAGFFCVSSDGTTSQGQFSLSRTGASSTATFADLGAASLSYRTFISVDLGPSVFDGETLDLRPLVGSRSVTAFANARVAFRADPAAAPVTWYRALLSGNVTLTLAPVATPAGGQ